MFTQQARPKLRFAGSVEIKGSGSGAPVGQRSGVPPSHIGGATRTSSGQHPGYHWDFW